MGRDRARQCESAKNMCRASAMSLRDNEAFQKSRSNVYIVDAELDICSVVIGTLAFAIFIFFFTLARYYCRENVWVPQYREAFSFFLLLAAQAIKVSKFCI